MIAHLNSVNICVWNCPLQGIRMVLCSEPIDWWKFESTSGCWIYIFIAYSRWFMNYIDLQSSCFFVFKLLSRSAHKFIDYEFCFLLLLNCSQFNVNRWKSLETHLRSVKLLSFFVLIVSFVHRFSFFLLFSSVF